MSETLSNLSHEERRFPPSAQFAATANVTAAAFEEAASDRQGFWAEAAGRLSWSRGWTQVLD